jgi:hypothetical protein
LTIGQKRNLAIEQATHDIILFMDDDDHYPTTSFRRRVAWLTNGTKCGQTSHCITCCTTLALYDLKRGVSAVNVPPYELPLSQRISEATLTFYKIAWEERKFPDVSVSEGEGLDRGPRRSVCWRCRHSRSLWPFRMAKTRPRVAFLPINRRPVSGAFRRNTWCSFMGWQGLLSKRRSECATGGSMLPSLHFMIYIFLFICKIHCCMLRSDSLPFTLFNLSLSNSFS